MFDLHVQWRRNVDVIAWYQKCLSGVADRPFQSLHNKPIYNTQVPGQNVFNTYRKSKLTAYCSD